MTVPEAECSHPFQRVLQFWTFNRCGDCGAYLPGGPLRWLRAHGRG